MIEFSLVCILLMALSPCGLTCSSFVICNVLGIGSFSQIRIKVSAKTASKMGLHSSTRKHIMFVSFCVMLAGMMNIGKFHSFIANE